jgi:hypothetical protein
MSARSHIFSILALACLLASTGCSSIIAEGSSAGGGAVGASIAHGVTHNAGAIAGEIATMKPGERRPWKIEHDIPIGNEHGEVTVTRAFTTRLAPCKELAFSVEEGNVSTS